MGQINKPCSEMFCRVGIPAWRGWGGQYWDGSNSGRKRERRANQCCVVLKGTCWCASPPFLSAFPFSLQSFSFPRDETAFPSPPLPKRFRV